MPIYDLTCKNEHKQRDLYLKMGERPACPVCGEATELLWDTPPAVIGDDIPGGVWMRHGVCNEDGSPRKYYTKSAIAAEAAKRGLTNTVRHATQPGTDKARHTTRWY